MPPHCTLHPVRVPGVGIPERKGVPVETQHKPAAEMTEREFMASQREPPKDLAGILDESAQTLFLTELWRGLGLTMKIFFEPSLTVRAGLGWAGQGLQVGASRHCAVGAPCLCIRRSAAGLGLGLCNPS